MKTNYDYERHKRLSESLGIEVEYKPRPTIGYVETWFPYIVYTTIILVLVFVFNIFMTIMRVDGPSMDPTLHSGQIALLAKSDNIERFDIVVLKEREVDGGETKNIIKRVIGKPGDTVTVKKGRLFINGEEYEEPYLNGDNIKRFKNESWEIKVPEEHYFVLGDNRDVSKDSRVVGSFKKSAVVGKKIM